LREARALVRFNRAALFPTISAGVGPARCVTRKSPVRDAERGTAAPATCCFSLDMSYEIDLWGRVAPDSGGSSPRGPGDGGRPRDRPAQPAGRAGEWTTSSCERGCPEAAPRRDGEGVRGGAPVTTNRFQGGAAPKSDVAQAQTQLGHHRAQATDVTVQRAQLEHAIATLIGQPPAAFRLSPRSLDTRPPEIPVGVPSQLLERRPEHRGRRASGCRGQRADRHRQGRVLSDVRLNASVGFEGTSFGNLLNASSLLWAVGRRLRRPSSTPASVGRGPTGSRRLRWNGRGITARPPDRVSAGRDNLAALRILEQEAQQQRRAVESAQQSLQLSPTVTGAEWTTTFSDHRADRDPCEPAQRDRHSSPSHRRQRAACEGARRRLGTWPSSQDSSARARRKSVAQDHRPWTSGRYPLSALAGWFSADERTDRPLKVLEAQRGGSPLSSRRAAPWTLGSSSWFRSTGGMAAAGHRTTARRPSIAGASPSPDGRTLRATRAEAQGGVARRRAAPTGAERQLGVRLDRDRVSR